jgi:hypothetical protein
LCYLVTVLFLLFVIVVLTTRLMESAIDEEEFC